MAIGETAKLLASLELQDKFTPGMNKALGTLDKAESRFGRISGLAQQGVQNFTRNVALIGVAAGGAIATQVAAGIRSLEELDRVMNATEGVIKSTGGAAGVTADQVRDLAQALESTTTADDKAIQSAENLLLTFTNIGKETFPDATKAVVDLGIAMAEGDVANADFKASAIQIGKALNDPIRGMTALRRVGVSFTKDQEKQVKALVESGKTMEAQRLILDELEKEFGEAGRAAGTGFGADMRRFGDAVEEAQQALAKGFLPLITKVSTVLSKKLGDPATLRSIEEFGNTLADSFEDILDSATRLPWQAIGESLKLAGTGAKAVLNAFTSLPPWVQTAVLTGWGLNKLTGGALGGIVGELGKGLIKGVLGIQAAQVNITAANVTGAGGLGAAGAAGGASKVGKVLSTVGKVFIVGAAIGVFAELKGILDDQGAQNRVLINDFAQQSKAFSGGASLSDLKTSLAGVDQQIATLNSDLSAEGIAFQANINGVRDAVMQSRADLVAGIADETRRLETAAALTKDDTVAAINRTSSLEQQQDAQTRASIISGTLRQISAVGAMSGTVSGAIRSAAERTAVASRAAGQQAAFAIRDKKMSFSTSVSVNTSVSVRDSITAHNNYKSVYRVAT